MNDRTNEDTRPRSLYHWVFLTLLLCLLGVVGNHLHIPLFFGVDFIFGSVAALCALAYLGPIAALLVALSAGAYTCYLWGHPYAAIVFVAEVVFVYFARRRVKHLALADGVFWVLVGIPLVILLYRGMLELPLMVSIMIALKQTVNGVLNAAIAASVLVIGCRVVRASPGVSLAGMIFNCLLVSILIPGIILIAMETRRSKVDSERAIADSIGLVAKFVDYAAKQLADDNALATEPASKLKELDLVGYLGMNDMLGMALIGYDGRVLAKVGEVHTTGDGQRIQTSDGVDVWLPPRNGMPLMVWWNKACYIHEKKLHGSGVVTSIVVEHSAAPVVANLHQRNLRAFMILFALTAFAIIVAILVSREFATPLRLLGDVSRRLANDIEKGKDIDVPHSDFQEIKTLAISFDKMASSLSENFQIVTDRTNQLEKLSSELAKFLSPQIYQSIFSGKQQAEIKTERKKLTVCFTDLTGFTDISTDMQPEDLTYLLNSYFSEMSDIAIKHGATIDKFIGDAMVIFFGDPETEGVSEDARACVRMAMEMQTKMQYLAGKWRSEGMENALQIRIGINTGFCNVGNFGSDQRMDYTIIGAEVNLAARLEALAKPGSVLMSGETYHLVEDFVDASEVQLSNIKGIKREVRAFAMKDITNPDASQHHSYRYKGKGLLLYVNPDELSADKKKAARNHLTQALKKLDAEGPSGEGG
ncbi:MAG: adenylate/guanylate cyclase domain-containing protein [Akkermansiaceae bacterium]|nr:adenylate/guanylate cyclase domain-containing protein [Akkermansiaceae bacterium]